MSFFHHLFLCGVSYNSLTKRTIVVAPSEVIPQAAGVNGDPQACLARALREITLLWSKVHSTFCAAAVFDNESIKQRLYCMCFLDLLSGDIYLWTCGKCITQKRRKLSRSSRFCYHGNIRKQGLCILYKVQILATCFLWNRGLERVWQSKSRSYVHRTLRSISDVSWEQNV